MRANTTSYPIFTIRSGEVTPGATIEKVHLRGVDLEIPALVVGEEGRGRARGLLPVAGWNPGPAGEENPPRLMAAGIGVTRAGKPKLLAASSPTSTEAAIVVLRTPIGYRGSNQHTGDRADDSHPLGWEYAPFPGKILVRGVVAQGAAGRMGAGDQLVALVPRGAVFRTAYGGRLYGAAAEHFYCFDGTRVLAATREEREASEIF